MGLLVDEGLAWVAAEGASAVCDPWLDVVGGLDEFDVVLCWCFVYCYLDKLQKNIVLPHGCFFGLVFYTL